MYISKTILRIALVLVLLAGLSSGAYFGYQNHKAAQALEENTEYQVLTAIETHRPEVYVVAVKVINGHALVYYTISDTDQSEEYFKQLAIDLMTALYNGYPNATAYHLLATRIIDMDTFEGRAHVGTANQGIVFTPRAASTLISSDNPVDDLDPLFEQGEIEFYLAQEIGVHLIQEPTPRERGHIPPWAEVEEDNIFKSLFD